MLSLSVERLLLGVSQGHEVAGLLLILRDLVLFFNFEINFMKPIFLSLVSLNRKLTST